MTGEDSQPLERGGKARDAFRTISEVADELGLAQHVLRFWESKFSQIRPLKRAGNRRYYRPADVRLLKAVQTLLHGEGYTVRGVQQLFREQGVKATIALALGEEPPKPASEEAARPAPSAASAAGNVASAKAPALKGLLEELKALRAEMDQMDSA